MIKHNVSHYVLINKIEEGCYGQVYKAINLLTDEDCAIKVYFDQGDIYNLRKEYDILSKLRHKNIIQSKSYFEQYEKKKTVGYLVMECGDIDLFEYMYSDYNLKKCINYIYDIIKGLEYLHQNNIVHCDLKLENIILCGDVAKISDFGLSEKLTSDKKRVNLVGTRGLIAPEINKGFCCKESDIWSFGKLLKLIQVDFTYNNNSLPHLSKIYNQCLFIDYKLRPSASHLRELFQDLYKDWLH